MKANPGRLGKGALRGGPLHPHGRPAMLPRGDASQQLENWAWYAVGNVHPLWYASVQDTLFQRRPVFYYKIGGGVWEDALQKVLHTRKFPVILPLYREGVKKELWGLVPADTAWWLPGLTLQEGIPHLLHFVLYASRHHTFTLSMYIETPEARDTIAVMYYTKARADLDTD